MKNAIKTVSFRVIIPFEAVMFALVLYVFVISQILSDCIAVSLTFCGFYDLIAVLFSFYLRNSYTYAVTCLILVTRVSYLYS